MALCVTACGFFLGTETVSNSIKRNASDPKHRSASKEIPSTLCNPGFHHRVDKIPAKNYYSVQTNNYYTTNFADMLALAQCCRIMLVKPVVARHWYLLSHLFVQCMF
jgi:hypothetical protein